MFIHGDDEYDLGHTVAGWTGVGIAVLGSGLCGLAMVKGSGLLALGGVAVLALALLTTWMLHLAGWGKPSGPRPAAQWDWRVRDFAAQGGHADCLGCRLAGRGAPRGQAADRPEGAAVASVLTADHG
ncbi:HGxxPAAW family protein [Streptomyces sp. NPDC059378]|uniref:HGxxPAAW family protein n=1 Tax=Streptomyces sp. NPDC059378 TaxID=3346815 RepID=UPI0036AB1259